MWQELSTISVVDSALRFSHCAAMLSHHDVREELIRQLDAEALRPKDVAARLKIPSARVSEMRRRDRRVQPDEMEPLAKLLKLSEDESKAPNFGGYIGTPADQAPTRSTDAGETAQLLRLDLSLPMGPGATVDEYIEEEPVEFDLGYLRAITRTPVHRLRLARGVGDSMFPTLQSSDEVLLDTTQNQLLHSDRIYAASINGGAAIKRLRPIEGGKRILVISDNKTIDPYPVDAREVVIWGRVIRFARDL
jgi:phage repressor protein C with HTH and peptisase S24 domain